MKVKLFHNEVEITDWYTDMEKYIREYKHLIGCEYVGSCFDTLDGATTWLFTEDKFEAGFDIKCKPIKFITHDDRLVSYKEYMNLYYPEYEHVWRYQL